MGAILSSLMALSTTSRLLKTLGDETRLRILNLLRKGELSVGELQEILNMGQSRISTQLTHLKEVGVLAHRKAGRRSFYSLCTCSSLELIVQVLDDAQLADEFRADDAGYQAAMEKRRQESRSYFDRVAAAFDEQVLPGRTWEGLARGILRLAPARPLRGPRDRRRDADAHARRGGRVGHRRGRLPGDAASARITGPREGDHQRRYTLEADIVDLPLESGSYDVAVLSQALHHAHDPGQALREARRILRPGGTACSSSTCSPTARSGCATGSSTFTSASPRPTSRSTSRPQGSRTSPSTAPPATRSLRT